MSAADDQRPIRKACSSPRRVDQEAGDEGSGSGGGEGDAGEADVVVDPNSCGFSGCGFQSSLSAINSAGTFGFFFNGAPGAFAEYQTGNIGSFDTIVISGGAGVPEPATWALMLVGFAGLGAALRLRGKKVVASA